MDSLRTGNIATRIQNLNLISVPQFYVICLRLALDLYPRVLHHPNNHPPSHYLLLHLLFLKERAGFLQMLEFFECFHFCRAQALFVSLLQWHNLGFEEMIFLQEKFPQRMLSFGWETLICWLLPWITQRIFLAKHREL